MDEVVGRDAVDALRLRVLLSPVHLGSGLHAGGGGGGGRRSRGAMRVEALAYCLRRAGGGDGLSVMS